MLIGAVIVGLLLIRWLWINFIPNPPKKTRIVRDQNPWKNHPTYKKKIPMTPEATKALDKSTSQFKAKEDSKGFESLEEMLSVELKNDE